MSNSIFGHHRGFNHTGPYSFDTLLKEDALGSSRPDDEGNLWPSHDLEDI